MARPPRLRNPGESRDPVTLLWVSPLSRQPTHIPVFSTRIPARGSLSLACPRESNQREGQPGCRARLRGFAAGGRVPLTGHPWPDSGRRAIPRASPSGLFVRPPPRHTGPKVKRRSKSTSLLLSLSLSLLTFGPPRARRVCGGRSPQGRAQGCARVRCRHTDVPSANLRSGLAQSAASPPTASSGVPFSLVTFSWASKRK